MKAKVRGLEASDNGNKFLCETCQWSSKRSGRHDQLQVFCGQMGDEKISIPFRVTQCDSYSDKNLRLEFRSLAKDARMNASYLDRRAIIDGQENENYLKFVDSGKAVKIGLVDKYDLW